MKEGWKVAVQLNVSLQNTGMDSILCNTAGLESRGRGYILDYYKGKAGEELRTILYVNKLVNKIFL